VEQRKNSLEKGGNLGGNPGRTEGLTLGREESPERYFSWDPNAYKRAERKGEGEKDQKKNQLQRNLG